MFLKCLKTREKLLKFSNRQLVRNMHSKQIIWNETWTLIIIIGNFEKHGNSIYLTGYRRDI